MEKLKEGGGGRGAGQLESEVHVSYTKRMSANSLV
jgi:hypothetical protein